MQKGTRKKTMSKAEVVVREKELLNSIEENPPELSAADKYYNALTPEQKEGHFKVPSPDVQQALDGAPVNAWFAKYGPLRLQGGPTIEEMFEMFECRRKMG